MSDWARLGAELDCWHAQRREATLWWRDDDAIAGSPALARLTAIASRHALPLALAVILAGLRRSLIEAVRAHADCTVLQHGYAHRNHAATGERARELGGTLAASAIERELAAGRARLREAFADRFVAAIVPPWNRIDASVVPRLPELGFVGLSTFGPRPAPLAAAGLVQCNTHVDPIAWRTGRTFAGAAACLEALVAHLRARREGRVDAREPTGLLTHHLVFDAPAWRFVDELAARTREHPAARWLDAREAFATSARSA